MKAISKNLAASRLCKKLSALRATLPNDERKILDSLVLANIASAKESVKAARQPIHFDQSHEEYRLIEP